MTCQPPPTVAHGHLVNSQASYVIGSTIQYGCNAIYSMTGGSTLQCVAAPTGASGSTNPPHWLGSYPICSLEFLETAWFWLLIGILGLLTLGLIACLTWFCIRYCCNNCRRQRKVRDAADIEEGQQSRSQCSKLWCGCCFYCMRTPEKTTDGCCDYFGCCGYAGCCSCCCWCCRCCREPVEPERTVRVRQGKHKHRSIFSIKRQRSVNKKKKMSLIKLRSKRQIARSTSLPTTQMVRSLIQDDPVMFRKVAKELPVWMPHTHSIRDINTSTK
ncbi:uncharacterized protein LOC110442605 [Mizuhopecten yessoensis]|uniref:Seizure 6-like protein 2 n=1 Tax=Mizuhopecten yessoensis TaxID=6573 RepID=A0A210PGV3_MIZYE|nr:uncharacterized protein LOC110442605 [Mizuhopecten yessoensis]OWF35708.1 Seizure 6-like protein 2 [Mizuhopecten yessoensis]